MSLLDKENDVNCANRLSGKVTTGVTKPRFGSMLAEVRKEIQVEDDNLLATDFQADEVAGIVKEWVQENRDMQMAAELAQTLEEEEAANRRLEILRGESEALKVAVEEKRRLKAEAEAKIQADRENEMLAKKFVEDEEKEYQRQRAAMLYADEKLCRQLSEDCGADEKQSLKIDHSSESKSRDCDAKEERKDWDMSDNEENEEEEEFEEEEEDEECKAQDVQDEFGHHAEQVIQQLEHDFELARHFQRQLDLEAKKMKLQLEAKDEAYSRKLQVLEERRAFMAKKRTQLRPLFEEHIAKFDATSPTHINETLVAQLWDTADADVDNVQNALCLTLLLPNIANVSVKLLYNNEEEDENQQSAVSRHSRTRLVSLRKRNPVIRIDATRLVHNKSLATTENTHYVAEFQLDPNAGSQGSATHKGRGRGHKKVGLKLSHRDIYYEYCSESGVLHVFVENILLNEAVYHSNHGVATQALTSANNNSRPVSSTSAKTAAPVKNLMLKQFQQGFLRIFGKGDTVSSKSFRK